MISFEITNMTLLKKIIQKTLLIITTHKFDKTMIFKNLMKIANVKMK